MAKKSCRVYRVPFFFPRQAGAIRVVAPDRKTAVKVSKRSIAMLAASRRFPAVTYAPGCGRRARKGSRKV